MYASKFVTPGSQEEKRLLKHKEQQKFLGVGKSSNDWVDLLGDE